MDEQTRGRVNAQAAVFKALAHPTRLFIAQELSKGERCVCELTALAGADTSTVSRHLTILRNAGIVADEKRGNQIFCTLKVPCVLRFLDCIDAVLASNAREQMALGNLI